MDTPSTYYINLPVFEGPFDLLLFFIERDELDILNIPIARITNDFLDYIRSMESINIELGSEFILVAATLMKIKARSLLPVKKSLTDNTEEDPKEELIKKLLLYKSFKEISEELSSMESHQMLYHERGDLEIHIDQMQENIPSISELESASLHHLMRTFNRLMEKLSENKQKTIHQVIGYPYTIETAKAEIKSLFLNQNRLNFEKVFSNCENRIHAIITFISILEMINAHEVHIIATENTNSFYLTPFATEVNVEDESDDLSFQ